MARTFLAVELPEDAKGEILGVQQKLRESGLLDAKYVDMENIHLTLKFFGEVSEQGIEEIQKRLGNIVFPSFNYKLGKLGFFGERVLWIDLEDEGEFKQLHDMIDNALSDLFEKDERFHNHITLARIKSINDEVKLKKLMDSLEVKPLQFSVKSFELYTSVLTKKGPVYEKVGSFDLISA